MTPRETGYYVMAWLKSDGIREDVRSVVYVWKDLALDAQPWSFMSCGDMAVWRIGKAVAGVYGARQFAKDEAAPVMFIRKVKL